MSRPNILFLMTDQCQAEVLSGQHPCKTPNLDRLAARGLKFTRAYTPNAICSPARASLMTGLLPHNHGVLSVTHTTDDDQNLLRTEKVHWAQRLKAVGYQTGYFGKSHIERSGDFGQFGWDVCLETAHPKVTERREDRRREAPDQWTLEHYLEGPPGYPPTRFYGANDRPDTASTGSIVCELAGEYLEGVLDETDPWCCFVSLQEPHDPFICSSATLAEYDIDALPLPPDGEGPGRDKPNLYRKAAQVFKSMTPRQKKEAAACYYASITEIDRWFGRLLDQVEDAGRMDNTIVVFTTDHGELLGAHGLYCKNIGAFEQVYNIPLLLTGPGIRVGESDARVGLHDLAPTLTELTAAEPLPETADSRSFAPILLEPSTEADDYQTGFAEYHGGRYLLTQRILWNDHWKLVFNGFDFDELYNLKSDPNELINRINDPDCKEVVRTLYRKLWQKLRKTGDHSLVKTGYPILRTATYGPGIADEAK